MQHEQLPEEEEDNLFEDEDVLEDENIVDENGQKIIESEVELKRRVAIKKVEMAPKPSAQLIEKCKQMSLQDIHNIDREVVEKGMSLFFSNQYVEAEAVFKQMQGQDPLVAASLAVLYSMRAMLSMEQQYINQACAYLLYASHFAREVCPPKKGLVSSALSGAMKWFKAPKEIQPMSASAFRASVVMAEAEVLRGIVLLLEETFSSYLKAGLALRRAYNIYDQLQQHLETYQAQEIAKGRLKKTAVAEVPSGSTSENENGDVDEAIHVGLGDKKRANTGVKSAAKERYGLDIDDNSYYGMHFGLGCIHITTSILPEKVLRILSTLGYMHDRTKGFHHMNECLYSGTIRAPLASLFVMAFHGMLPSFTPLMLKGSLPAAAKADRATKRLFPKSIIHLWVSGRIHRLKRFNEPDEPSDIEIFQKCVKEGAQSSLAQALPQLKDIALYDLAWSHVARLEWYHAAQCFKELEESSMWSKCFYAYAQGTCWEMLGSKVRVQGGGTINGEHMASKCYYRSIEYRSIRLGGKVMSIDQFVLRRVNRMIAIGKQIYEVMGDDGSDSVDKYGGPYLLKNTTYKVPGLELAMLFSMLPQMRSEHLATAQALVARALQSRNLRNAEKRHTSKQLSKAIKGGQETLEVNTESGTVDQFEEDLSDSDNISVSASETGTPSSGAPSSREIQRAQLHWKFNAGIKEDKAVLVLLYANLCREMIRSAELLNEHVANTKGTGLNPVPLTKFSYDNVLSLYKKIEDEEPSTNGTATTLDGTHPINPQTGLLELPNFGLYKMTCFDHESWVLPHMLYEVGVTYYYQGQPAKCKEQLMTNMKHSVSGKDYNFEMVMQFRLHLGSDVLKSH